MKVIDFIDASEDLGSVLDQVTETSSCAIISDEHRDDVVIMSVEYYNQLMETLYQLKHSESEAYTD